MEYTINGAKLSVHRLFRPKKSATDHTLVGTVLYIICKIENSEP